jgi:Tetratricopeptide repeat.
MKVLYNLGLALYNLDRLDEAQEALSSASAFENRAKQSLTTVSA